MPEIEQALIVRMEATLNTLEKQMTRALKVTGDTATGIQGRFDQMGDRVAANANRAAKGITSMNRSAGASRFVLQNTANQLGDIAVQISGGTSAARAMSQQLPQMFGGFSSLGGALGVVGPLLGTVAAIGIPVAIALASMGEEAASLDERLKALEKSIAALKSAQSLDGLSAGSLVTEYGDLADEAREVFEINRKIASLRANSAMSDVTRGFAGRVGVEGVLGFGPTEIREMEATIASLEDELDGLNKASQMSDAQMAAAFARIPEIRESLGGLKSARAEFDALAESLGITKEEAREFSALLAVAGQAKGPRDAADATAEMLVYLESVIGRTGEATEDGKALRDAIAEAAVQFFELAKIDIASTIAEGTAEAGRLKAELAAALALFNQTQLAGSKVYSGRGGDPRKMDDQYTREMGYQDVDALIAKYTPRTSTRGGGGGADKALTEAKRLFESTRTEAEKYAAEMERINELHRQFPEIVTAEVRDRAVEALNEGVSKLSDAARTLENALEDMFVSIVDGSASAKDAVASLLQEMSRLLAHSAFKSLGVGKVFDGFFDGLFKPRAGGGTVSAGASYMVGEAGPEPFFPKVDGRVLSVAQAQAALRGGSQRAAGGSVHVSVGVDRDGNLVPVIEKVSGNIAARTVQAGIRQYDRGPARATMRDVMTNPRVVSR
ncbi:hypothetical protein [Arenibacterium halophilum]|uniref:Uncharacterized protein n=1 Tax=Arenibacterium halophilum TaxID=2583821 RepID=A0ABY2WXQ3_9RHOB|nr:hypothetical protein [Arenibacterium halophilum]TMV07317.1 hypothetical protein FGK64_21945 [Arenibacterium halophilum]